MYEKILVCLDGSKLAEQVLPYIAELARNMKSAVILLRVVPEPVIPSPAIPGTPGVPVVTSRMGRHAEEEEHDSEAYLSSVADRMAKEQGLRPECATALGAPGLVIVDYATKNAVGLIAIATHGRSGLGRALLGSVADFVTRQSRLPVLLIRPTAGQ